MAGVLRIHVDGVDRDMTADEQAAYEQAVAEIKAEADNA